MIQRRRKTTPLMDSRGHSSAQQLGAPISNGAISASPDAR
jgi:hypothetical protein